jgi:hypothetical protein
MLTSEDIEVLTKLWPKARKKYNKADLVIARTRFEGSYCKRQEDEPLYFSVYTSARSSFTKPFML